MLERPEVEGWYDAAKSEGEVNYYASNNPALSQRMAEGFNKRYPEIKVNIVRLASGPLGKRYATEAEAGTFVADILQLGDPTIIRDGYQKGWFTRIDELPSHAAWPEEYKAENYAVANIFPGTITYNTTLVPDGGAPKAWPDILDPKWKGLILAPDLRTSPTNMHWAKTMIDTYGEEFLTGLAAQDIRWVPSTVPGTQMLAAGESALLLQNLRMVSYSVIEQGGPIDDVMLEPNTGLESLVSISTQAPNPNSARLLVNYVLSPEGQALLVKDVGASPLGNIPGALPLPSDYRQASYEAISEALAMSDRISKLVGLS
ncbi:MAG: extracellular solute-binding protein [Tistlia sp.]|uniref:ABC transporter substrate-binding protein n=1 Tax=Tistlia sp. TaxID=3057121 RepID=UPI0034A21535